MVGHGACSVLVPVELNRMIKNGTERAMNRIFKPGQVDIWCGWQGTDGRIYAICIPSALIPVLVTGHQSTRVCVAGRFFSAEGPGLVGFL
ncbi:protein of unknown function [Agrobacterium pusense]|uniref:Uncharacterized protein n=1 Tax=Agrobacterium pusense TaxID=648995 RepID=U4PWM2_9HYPH|nr:protein of unknown function [Agrobacterium pusense]